MPKFASLKELCGLAVSIISAIAVSAWLVSARVTTAEADIAALKTDAANAAEDHDTLTRMEADINWLREAVRDIRDQVVPQKDARSGNR